MVTYILLYKTDAKILQYYSSLIAYSTVLVTLLELTQITNFAFKISRLLKDRIDFNKGILQTPAIWILFLSGFSMVLILKSSLWSLKQEIDFYSGLITCLLFVCTAAINLLSTIGRYYQGIVSNGMLVGAYFALSTALNQQQMQVIDLGVEVEKINYVDWALELQKLVSNQLFSMLPGGKLTNLNDTSTLD